MGYLLERKTHVIFVTASKIEEDKKRREVVIESRPEFAIVQLNGSKEKYPASWEEIYEIAKARHIENQRLETRSKKKKQAGARTRKLDPSRI